MQAVPYLGGTVTLLESGIRIWIPKLGLVMKKLCLVTRSYDTDLVAWTCPSWPMQIRSVNRGDKSRRLDVLMRTGSSLERLDFRLC